MRVQSSAGRDFKKSVWGIGVQNLAYYVQGFALNFVGQNVFLWLQLKLIGII